MALSDVAVRSKRRTPEAFPQTDHEHRGWERSFAAMLLAIDVLAMVAGGVLAAVFRDGAQGLDITTNGLAMTLAALLPVAGIILLRLGQAYEPRFIADPADEAKRVLRVLALLGVTLAIVSWAADSRTALPFVFLGLPVAGVLSLFGRYFARRRIRGGRVRGQYTHWCLLVGSSETVAEAVHRLRRDGNHGLAVIGACVTDPDAMHNGGLERVAAAGLPVLGSSDQLVEAVRQTDADTVIMLPGLDLTGPAMRGLTWQLHAAGARIGFLPALSDLATDRLVPRTVDGLPLLYVKRPSLSGGRRLVKSVVERVVAAVALILLAPLMIGVAVAVRTTSSGPAFFRQTRIGRGGREFTMVKFRTMCVDAEARKAELSHLNESDGLLFKMRADPRITPLGAMLRKYSLDELPQLFNVLGGSMSLVGPRPQLPEEVANYTDELRPRLHVRPGLTGLWQVSGRSDLTWEESVRLDLSYVENWSLGLDVRIIARTGAAVLRGTGAY